MRISFLNEESGSRKLIGRPSAPTMPLSLSSAVLYSSQSAFLQKSSLGTQPLFLIKTYFFWPPYFYGPFALRRRIPTRGEDTWLGILTTSIGEEIGISGNSRKSGRDCAHLGVRLCLFERFIE